MQNSHFCTNQSPVRTWNSKDTKIGLLGAALHHPKFDTFLLVVRTSATIWLVPL